MSTTTLSLEQQYLQKKTENPHAYPRAIAAELGVHEADVLPFTAKGRVFEIDCNLTQLYNDLTHSGKIKLMVRNDFAVLEMFAEVQFTEAGEYIYLHWPNGIVKINTAGSFRLYRIDPESPGENSEQKISFQLYSKAGDALVKFFIPLAQYKQIEQSSMNEPAAFLKDKKVSLQAEKESKNYPELCEKSAARELIEKAGHEKSYIGFSLSLENLAAQVKHNPVKIVDARGWFNILDDDFNLHLKEDLIDQVCRPLEKTTELRVVHQSEFLDVFAANSDNDYQNNTGGEV